MNKLEQARQSINAIDKQMADLFVQRMQAVRMVSAAAQAQMLKAIEEELTEAEADVARRGRNAQAKHAAPKNADPADYAHATGLEALWGYLFVTGETQRLAQLVTMALERTKDIWQKRN